MKLDRQFPKTVCLWPPAVICICASFFWPRNTPTQLPGPFRAKKGISRALREVPRAPNRGTALASPPSIPHPCSPVPRLPLVPPPRSPPSRFSVFLTKNHGYYRPLKDSMGHRLHNHLPFPGLRCFWGETMGFGIQIARRELRIVWHVVCTTHPVRSEFCTSRPWNRRKGKASPVPLPTLAVFCAVCGGRGCSIGLRPAGSQVGRYPRVSGVLQLAAHGQKYTSSSQKNLDPI